MIIHESQSIWNLPHAHEGAEDAVKYNPDWEALDISQPTAQRYESGEIKNIPYDKLALLAEILQCSPPYLLGWESMAASPPDIPGDEERMLRYFRKLNVKGKKEAARQLENLTLIPKYSKSPDN